MQTNFRPSLQPFPSIFWYASVISFSFLKQGLYHINLAKLFKSCQQGKWVWFLFDSAFVENKKA